MHRKLSTVLSSCRITYQSLVFNLLAFRITVNETAISIIMFYDNLVFLKIVNVFTFLLIFQLQFQFAQRDLFGFSWTKT